MYSMLLGLMHFSYLKLLLLELRYYKIKYFHESALSGVGVYVK
jgi:hypothetical protein